MVSVYTFISYLLMIRKYALDFVLYNRKGRPTYLQLYVSVTVQLF